MADKKHNIQTSTPEQNWIYKDLTFHDKNPASSTVGMSEWTISEILHSAVIQVFTHILP